MFLGYSGKKLLGAWLFLSMFMIQLSFAEGSGTVKGTVFDKAGKDKLPGANIVVKGTSNGTTTNLDGAFTLRNAPAGEQTLVVSYLGYRSETVVVNILDGGTVSQNFYLVAEAIEGEEVVVTGQAQGQLQAINQQLSSNKIANIVSEARIQELPDFNAAQAISRLPGVSTLQSSGEANKVVIRGLAPQFNQITVGGVSLASTGSTQIGITSLSGGSINQDRGVDLSMITPYMLKSVAVYKTLTPDLNANAIGGVVNMELREAPVGFHSDLLFQSGYTNKTKEYGNFRAVLSASDRFFDGLFGVYALANAEQYDRASDNMSASYSRVGSARGDNGYDPVVANNVSLTRHFETRKRYGGNLILDYALPSGSLRSVNMYSRLNSNSQDYVMNLHYAAPSQGQIDFSYRRSKPTTEIALNTLEFQNDFDFMSINLKFANNYSRNYLSEGSPFYQFSQTGGIALTGANVNNLPPEALFSNVTDKGTRQTFLNNISNFGADFKENDQVYKADLKFPIPISSDFSGFIKVGGEYRFGHQKNDQSTPYLTVQSGSRIATQLTDSIRARYPFLVYDSLASRFPTLNFTSGDKDLYASFLDNRFGQLFWMTNPSAIDAILSYTRNNPLFSAADQDATNPGGWYDGGFQNLPNDYKYIEKYYAGYAMAELTILSDVRVVGGARYEQVRSLFETFNLMDGRNPKTQNVFPITAYPENHYWLPMVQAKYDAFDWFDIRYSYTQTLARPDYHQLSPHISMSNDRLNVYSGNPRLTPAQAYNHDLQFTFHNNDIGLISIGGFYKTVSNFTYFTTYQLYRSYDPTTRLYAQIPAGLDTVDMYKIGGTSPNNGANLYTYFNSQYDAYVKGIEADIQTRFWYLPAPLDGIVLGLNYTHIWSTTTYPWHETRTTTDRVTRITTARVIDSTRTGRLIFQPNDVMNLYIGYDYEGFSGRVSCVFQGNSVTNVGNYDVADGFSKDYFRVDASARQTLPWAGLQLYLDVNNINARKNQSAQVSIGGFTSEQNYGLTANLGVRFTL